MRYTACDVGGAFRVSLVRSFLANDVVPLLHYLALLANTGASLSSVSKYDILADELLISANISPIGRAAHDFFVKGAFGQPPEAIDADVLLMHHAVLLVNHLPQTPGQRSSNLNP